MAQSTASQLHNNNINNCYNSVRADFTTKCPEYNFQMSMKSVEADHKGGRQKIIILCYKLSILL